MGQSWGIWTSVRKAFESGEGGHKTLGGDVQ